MWQYYRDRVWASYKIETESTTDTVKEDLNVKLEEDE